MDHLMDHLTALAVTASVTTDPDPEVPAMEETMVAKKREATIVVNEIRMNEVGFCVLGQSPMIMHRYLLKAWQELLLPSRRKTAAERDRALKHDPFAEFRGAVYRNRDSNTASLIHVPHGAFHGALASAAIDIPGATKAKMERLTSITDVTVELFGIPHIFCAMVRNSDQNRTPDVRTRPIFPEWACRVTIQYVKDLLTERAIGNLFGAAGTIVGIGDWRPQKGGPYGRWRVVQENNADFRRIIGKQGRNAQVAALQSPSYYDDDTKELLEWFQQEIRVREREDQLSDDTMLPDVPIHTVKNKDTPDEEFVGKNGKSGNGRRRKSGTHAGARQ
jgi:hypothetical protein